MIPFVVLAALIPIAYALTINTPMTAVVCQPLQFTWATDGSPPPYYISLIPAGQPAANALKQFPPQEGSSYTWPRVTLRPGTSFNVVLKDGNGQQVYSAPVTVQNGRDSSCVDDEVMEGKEASGASSATPTNGSPGVAAVSHGTASDAPSNPVAAAATGSAPAPTSTAPASAKSEAAKSSSGSASPSPSQHPSVKANSVSRDISSGAIVGIMIAVGLTSILVSLVV